MDVRLQGDYQMHSVQIFKKLPIFVCLFWTSLLIIISNSHALSLREAVENTVRTNPQIAEARLNRRAATREHYQAKGRLLPQVDTFGDVGRQVIDRPLGFIPPVNNVPRTRRQLGIGVNQIIFDGWDRANDIYKSSSRIDSAAWQVFDRSEALGLNAVEAYIDVLRNQDSLRTGRRNVSRHQEILRRVRILKEGGKAGEGELNQILERLAAAQVAVEQIRRSLLQTEARFRRIVGLQPKSLRPTGYPKGLTLSRQQYIETARTENPAILSATADADAAMYEFRQSKSSYFPEISLDVTNTWGYDVDGTPGRNNDLSGSLVLTWNLFDGLIKSNRHAELADRWGQALAVRDEKRREIVEQIESALATLETGRAQVELLQRRVIETRKVTQVYEKEFQLGKRTLVDLVNAERIQFNTEIQLISANSVSLFSAYQVLASMGQLLDNLGVTPPPEADLYLETSFFPRRSQERELDSFAVDLEPLRSNTFHTTVHPNRSR